MNQMTQKLHSLLEQEDTMVLEDYIRILYEACEKHPYCNEVDILQVREELEAHLADMEFRQQDCILSTVNSLCATYDYAGFAEGFRRGSELVLRMVGSK